MTFKEIKELIEVFDSSNLASLSIKDKDFRIELDKSSKTTIQPQPQQEIIQAQTPAQVAPTQPTTPPAQVEGETINSPMVGTFYQAPSPDSPPYVKVGDKVKAGQTVCIVEAMKIMNEIQAEFDCEILEVLVEDGQAVEFDTPLFKVKRV
jgi:acetyl-CoA carboxylase biotin carboxyl carrier protein